ncbi:MAG: hypothetical protein IJ137_00215 [Eubacterium sp.]|nr:hypothetical protein [Eubacterium sp.]
MAEKYKVNLVNVTASDAHAVTAIKTASAQSVKAVLTRMEIEYAQGFPVEVYAMALYDEICENPQLILEMLPGEVLHFLIEIWEKDQLQVDAQHWDYLQYLAMFGFAFSMRKDDGSPGSDTICYIRDMKDQFYFFLKSRSSRRAMDRYTEWEMIIRGLLYCYGLAEMKTLYRNSLIVSRVETASYEEFDHFMKCRASMWGIGMFLRTTDGKTEYMQHMYVENPERTLREQKEHDELDYCLPDKDQLIFLAQGGGLDRNWKGLSDLFKLLSEDLKMDYYKASISIRTMVTAIQNGWSGEALYNRIQSVTFADDRQRERGLLALEQLCDIVPLFSLKGNSRSQVRKMAQEEELKQKKQRFSIVTGEGSEGKHEG